MFKKLVLFAVVLLTIANAQENATLCGEGCVVCPLANQCAACGVNYTLQANLTCTLSNITAAPNATNATNATNGTNGTAVGGVGVPNVTNATNATNATIVGNPNCSIANCQICNDSQTTCNLCIQGFWFDPTTFNGTCQSCGPNCNNCTTNGTCTICAAGFTLTGNQCNQTASGAAQPTTTPVPVPVPIPVPVPVASNPPNAACATQYCSSCSADGQTCTICQDGYFLAGTQCLQCQSNCLACNDANTCNTCSSGYYPALPAGSTTGTTVQANTQSACTVCPSGCTQCTNANLCTTCASGYRLLTLPSATTCASAFSGKLTLSIAAVFLGLIAIFIH